jgi:hypothetical protein
LISILVDTLANDFALKNHGLYEDSFRASIQSKELHSLEETREFYKNLARDISKLREESENGSRKGEVAEFNMKDIGSRN